jgi:lysophospholipase L1-like esterase
MKVRPRVLIVSASLVALLIPAAVAVAGPIREDAPPLSMASLGDSITRGFNACGWFVDCTVRSYATGTSTSINSHYLRLRAVNSAINGRNYNEARSGARIADLPGQANAAVSRGAQYVTILLGANDACTGSEASMTSVAAFRTSVNQALTTLKGGLPNARVFIISIPDIKRLWEVGSASPSARGVWGLFSICQSMLANSASTAQPDVYRRARVQQRVIDFNTQLAEACAVYGPNCKFDNNAVFKYPFQLSQLSTWDYFHPNALGQAILADISYTAGYGW